MRDNRPLLANIVAQMCEQRGWLLLGNRENRENRVLRDLDRDGYIVRIAASPTWRSPDPFHHVFISGSIDGELHFQQADRVVGIVADALDDLERKLAPPRIDTPLRWSPYPWSPHP